VKNYYSAEKLGGKIDREAKLADLIALKQYLKDQQ
jgi:hypothetical protein